MSKITEIVSNNGSQEELLEALLSKISETLDTCQSGRDVAALSRRLVEVSSQLEELRAHKQDNPLDSLLKKREREKQHTYIDRRMRGAR